MGQVTVRDRMIWTNHIQGDAPLVARIESLQPGETLELIVENAVRGIWERCAGESGPVAIRPVDSKSKATWKVLFEERRGQDVDVRDVGAPAERWEQATDAERDAAWEAFKALTRAGWRSEAPIGTRDDLHER